MYVIHHQTKISPLKSSNPDAMVPFASSRLSSHSIRAISFLDLWSL